MKEVAARIIEVTKAALEKEMSAVFLESEEIAVLTGRKMKGHQIQALRHMGIPFFVNATGHPVVTRSAIEGKKDAAPMKQAWIPKVLRNA